jgi:hypothetical protein
MLLHKSCRTALLALISAGGITSATALEFTGPSSSQSPYLVSTKPGVTIVSLLTVGDSVNTKPDGVTPYRMVGIPDGLGAFPNDDGETFTVLMNHELPGTGIGRDHGFKGAFVSKWIINRNSLKVLNGEDLIKHAWRWDLDTYSYQPVTNAFSRFCSGDLPPLSAFYNQLTGKGYPGRIYMNGEESGTEGRAMAHFLDGNSYELPWLGKMAWENSVANGSTGDKTVVMGTDDGAGGQVYVYIGSKQQEGSPVQRAGLANGNLYGIKVTGFPAEDLTNGIPSGTAFTCVNFGDVSSWSGVQLNTNSINAEVTTFMRPEDGCWDPAHPNDFYFVTTASFTGPSRLWKLHFTSLANPAAGGSIEQLLTGSEGQKMMDNITIDSRGQLIALEDVGDNAHIGKVWKYNIASHLFEMIAQHDPARFTPGAPGFVTQDEESSGVINMEGIYSPGCYLLDVQSHARSADPELVEDGQLLLMFVPPGKQSGKDAQK